ncbi:MAG: hypothetical protein JXR76_05745 [Deltaproteobacteria bacterium]|nr:hypothetical protein [Deltaproteobacteria bacterium]
MLRGCIVIIAGMGFFQMAACNRSPYLEDDDEEVVILHDTEGIQVLGTDSLDCVAGSDGCGDTSTDTDRDSMTATEEITEDSDVGDTLSPADTENCYGPDWNMETAYADDATGCPCNPVSDEAFCKENVALMCDDTSGQWMAVEEGPCAMVEVE